MGKVEKPQKLEKQPKKHQDKIGNYSSTIVLCT
jgi:hypothetical protein